VQARTLSGKVEFSTTVDHTIIQVHNLYSIHQGWATGSPHPVLIPFLSGQRCRWIYYFRVIYGLKNVIFNNPLFLLSMLWLARFLSSKNWPSSNFELPIPAIHHTLNSCNFYPIWIIINRFIFQFFNIVF